MKVQDLEGEIKVHEIQDDMKPPFKSSGRLRGTYDRG